MLVTDERGRAPVTLAQFLDRPDQEGRFAGTRTGDQVDGEDSSGVEGLAVGARQRIVFFEDVLFKVDQAMRRNAGDRHTGRVIAEIDRAILSCRRRCFFVAAVVVVVRMIMVMVVLMRVVGGFMRMMPVFGVPGGGAEILEYLGPCLVVVIDHQRRPLVGQVPLSILVTVVVVMVIVTMFVVMVMTALDLNFIASASAYLAHYSTSKFLILSSCPVSRRS